jgi:hypothetical protein
VPLNFLWLPRTKPTQCPQQQWAVDPFDPLFLVSIPRWQLEIPEIKNNLSGRVLTPWTTKENYQRVQVKLADGTRHNRMAHDVIAETYMPRPAGEDVDCHHRNKNRE